MPMSSDGATAATPTDATHATRRTDPLRLTVVRYSDGPDRCTIYPRGLAGDARLTTWLSADRSLLVDAAEMR